MYAVVNQVKIESGKMGETEKMVNDVVIPRVKGFAGFKSGTWLRSVEGDRGYGVLLFASEQDAKAAAERFRTEGPPPGMPITIESTGAFEVFAEA